MARIWSRKVVFIVLCLSVVLSFWSGQELWAMELEVGQPFPSHPLPSLEDGRASSIAQFRGQKLVLHIWASW